VSNLSEILAYLEGPALGLSPDQAAGVAGNLEVESGLDPGAYNARENAHGLAQWEGGRWTRLQQFAAQNGAQPTDLVTQLQFLGAELHGPEAGALAQLRATSDPATAAAVFDQSFERSSGSSRATRVADAKAIAAGQDPSGHAAATGPAGSSSSSPGQSVAARMGGLFGWEGAAFTIGVKVLGAAAAAGLVIVGATHTVSSN